MWAGNEHLELILLEFKLSIEGASSLDNAPQKLEEVCHKILSTEVEEGEWEKGTALPLGSTGHILTLVAAGGTVERVTKIPRCEKVPNIYFNSAQQIQAYDFDQVIFDGDSPYQNVKILHSPQFGNVLILDDYINLADSDVIYTHSVMQKGVVNYENAEVLILGGGDGGLLHEILKEKPAFVTMIDIDELVIDVCRKHLRKACGDSMDERKGPHHQIIVDDCFVHVDKYIASGKKFDVIISDLTDTPLVDDPKSKQEFTAIIERVITSSRKILKTDGRFLTHLTGMCSPKVMEDYEAMLTEMGLKFQRSHALVPSFLETWSFYMVWQ